MVNVYLLPEFQEKDREAIVDFVRRHPLAMITGISDEGTLVASHIPLLIKDAGQDLILRGHVMRKTDHWKGFKANAQVLVAFTGPNAPIQASWYANTNNGGTWNYIAVHARGDLRFLPQEELVEILRELKNIYETDKAAKFETLTPEYVPGMISAIEGFEICVESLSAVFKLSQNHDDADFENVVAELDKQGGEPELLAQEMRLQRSRMNTAALP